MSGTTVDPRYSAARVMPKRGMQFSWSDPVFRAIVWQVVVVAALVLLIWFLVHNTAVNLDRQHITASYSFVTQPATIPIADSLLSWTPNVSTYGRAFVIGILNTLLLALPGIVLATILGTLVGVGRLSKNFLLAKITAVYVEVLRDIPVLLQLFAWSKLFQALPSAKQAYEVGPWYLSIKGFLFPKLDWQFSHTCGLLALIAGIAGYVAYMRRARGQQEETGVAQTTWPAFVGLCIAFPILIWAVSGADFSFDVPKLTGLNFKGGGAVHIEYLALLTGLVVYTSTYIAEIVRSGIQAVPLGQWEAAGALGLPTGRVLRQIILPQAMRVVIPPMTSQFLNITKNSSLGVAIGFAETVGWYNAIQEPTSQAITGMTMVMAVYLAISLSISLFMNWYNKRIALVER